VRKKDARRRHKPLPVCRWPGKLTASVPIRLLRAARWSAFFCSRAKGRWSICQAAIPIRQPGSTIAQFYPYLRARRTSW
jgi:hypothetical protein